MRWVRSEGESGDRDSWGRVAGAVAGAEGRGQDREQTKLDKGKQEREAEEEE